MTSKEALLAIVQRCEALERYVQSLEVRVEALEAKKKRSSPGASSKALTVAKTTTMELSPALSVTINYDLLHAWADTYPEEFLKDELKKARNWVLSNPHKAPKSQWGKFINSWFTRAWEQHRKTLKSNPVMLSTEELEKILGTQDANT